MIQKIFFKGSQKTKNLFYKNEDTCVYERERKTELELVWVYECICVHVRGYGVGVCMQGVVCMRYKCGCNCARLLAYVRMNCKCVRGCVHVRCV